VRKRKAPKVEGGQARKGRSRSRHTNPFCGLGESVGEKGEIREREKRSAKRSREEKVAEGEENCDGVTIGFRKGETSMVILCSQGQIGRPEGGRLWGERNFDISRTAPKSRYREKGPQNSPPEQGNRRDEELSGKECCQGVDRGLNDHLLFQRGPTCLGRLGGLS